MLSTHEEEKKKYDQCWEVDGYRVHSPGENSLKAFEEIVKPFPGSSITDCGSGTARASLALAMSGHTVHMLDITENSMDEEVHKEVPNMDNLHFTEMNLWDSQSMSNVPYSDYTYCCDVMEHIPTEYVMLTLQNILNLSTRGAFFYICLVPDAFGQVIGKPLHLTVRPFRWWRNKLSELGHVVDARDLLSNGIYYISKEGVQ